MGSLMFRPALRANSTQDARPIHFHMFLDLVTKQKYKIQNKLRELASFLKFREIFISYSTTTNMKVFFVWKR